MTDAELQALVAQNSQDIAGLKQTLSTLISDVIRPLSEGAVAVQQLSSENATRSTENERLFQTLLSEAREDRMNAQKRFEAQQEAMRAILLQIANLNSDVEER